MEHALAQQRKTCSTIAHALDKFQFVHFSFDEAVVLGKGESCNDSYFISLKPKGKVL